jgi:hypothetical protein
VHALAVAPARPVALGGHGVEVAGEQDERAVATHGRAGQDAGIAGVADLDAAVASGPGLRWALLGPFAVQHLSGGPGGIAHVLEHLGPPTEAWWRDMGDPSLTPALVDKIVAGVDAELDGTDPAELVARRDAALRALLATKAEHGLP